MADDIPPDDVPADGIPADGVPADDVSAEEQDSYKALNENLDASPFGAVLRRLCETENDDARTIEAQRLRDAVEAYWRTHARAAGEHVSRDLDATLEKLVKVHWDVRFVLGGIAGFAALVHLIHETQEESVQRTNGAVSVLERFTLDAVPDVRVAEAYADLAVLYAREYGAPVARHTKSAINTALNGLIDNADHCDPAVFSQPCTVSPLARYCIVIARLGAAHPHAIIAGAAAGAADATTNATAATIVDTASDTIANTIADTVLAVYNLIAVIDDPTFQCQAAECITSLLVACQAIPDTSERTSAADATVEVVVSHVDEALLALTENAPVPDRLVPAVSGALAVVRALITRDKTPDVAALLRPKFEKFREFAIRNVSSSHLRIQRAATDLLILLAKADPDGFCESQIVSEALEHFEKQARHATTVVERSSAVDAYGAIACEITEDQFRPFLKSALILCNDLLSEVLRVDGREDTLSVSSVVRLVTSVSNATEPEDEDFLARSSMLVAKLFHTGVSEPLVDALVAVIHVDRHREPYVQNILIRKLEAVLAEGDVSRSNMSSKMCSPEQGERNPSVQLERCLFRSRQQHSIHPGFVGALESHRHSQGGQISSVKLPTAGESARGIEELRRDVSLAAQHIGPTPSVALLTLSTFNFTMLPPVRLAWFANQFVIKYLDSSRSLDRRLAAKACGNLMRCAVSIDYKRNRFRDETLMMLSQLVSVAVVDPCRTVRLCILEELKSDGLSRYLAQEYLMARLGLCLNDDDYEVRQSALALFCDLSPLNPPVSETVLGVFLKRLCALLRCPSSTGDRPDPFSGIRVQATHHLQTLLQSPAREFMRRYDGNVIPILLLLLKDRLFNVSKIDVDATLPILLALGHLASDVTTVLEPYAQQLVPLLVTAVLDVNPTSCQSEFRLATLRALSRVVQNTSLSVVPYIIDGRLFMNLMASLGSEHDEDVRFETIALLGAVGAGNPERDQFKHVSPSVVPSSSGQTYRHEGHHHLGASIVWSGVSGSTYRVSSRHVGEQPSARTGVGSATGRIHDTPLVSHVDSPGQVPKFIKAERPPPAVGNAARGVDFEWLAEVYNRKNTAVWQQVSLRTDSFVSGLRHPYTANPEYAPSLVLDLLHQVISQAKYAAQHQDAVNAMVRVVEYIRKEGHCEKFLAPVVARLLWLLRPGDNEKDRSPMSSYLSTVFAHFATLVEVLKTEIEPCVIDTVALCYAYLAEEDPSYREPAVSPVTDLLRALRAEFGSSFRPYALHVMAPLISAMIRDTTPRRNVTTTVLSTLESFGSLYMEYAGIILPAFSLVYEDEAIPCEVRCKALASLAHSLGLLNPVSDLASSVMHSLVRVLATQSSCSRHCDSECRGVKGIHKECALALSEVSKNCQAEFLIFVPMVAKAIVQGDVNRGTDEYLTLELVLMQSNADVFTRVMGSLGENVEEICRRTQNFDTRLITGGTCGLPNGSSHGVPGGHPSGEWPEINARVDLRRAGFDEDWDGFSAADWNHWLDRFGIELLQQSTSYAMKPVAVLAARNPWFLRSVFNAAFWSCWPSRNGNDVYCHKVVTRFQDALLSKTIPLNVKQVLLGLVEFMDHAERPMAIDPDILTRAAVDVGAFAKAVKYRESQYIPFANGHETADSLSVLRKVISDTETGLLQLYCQLGDKVSAAGILDHFEEMFGKEEATHVREKCYENLMFFNEALSVYRKASAMLPRDIDFSKISDGSDQRGKLLFQKGSDCAASSSRDEHQTAEHRTPCSPQSLEDSEVNSSCKKDVDFTKAKEHADLKWYLTLSELRILDRLGKWQEMEAKTEVLWEELDGNPAARASLAVEGRAASVAFDLGAMGKFMKRADCIPVESWPGRFYRSLVCVQRSLEIQQSEGRELNKAWEHINAARRILDTGLTSRAAEGYPRAYDHFLDAQHLVEMEEMLAWARAGRPQAVQDRLKALWNMRQRDAKQDQNTWYRLLMTRSLLLSPMDCKNDWLKFVTLCRKENRLPVATEALRKLVRCNQECLGDSIDDRDARKQISLLLEDKRGTPPPVTAWECSSLLAIPDMAVAFACIKHLWGSEKYLTAFNTLRKRVSASNAMDRVTYRSISVSRTKRDSSEEDVKLYGEMYLKLAKWSMRVDALYPSERHTSLEETKLFAWKATQWRPTWYKSWHFWASLNASQARSLSQSYEKKLSVASGAQLEQTRAVCNDLEGRRMSAKQTAEPSGQHSLIFSSTAAPVTKEIKGFLTNAVNGYFSAIKHSGKTSLEDLLTLLSLWFKYGSDASLDRLFSAGFKFSSLDCWLDVIPQIIARLHSPHELVRKGIENLLIRVGCAHPHAAVYPLTVASRSPEGSTGQRNRRDAAIRILKSMRVDHKEIVDQAGMVARELNRVAVLDHEKWYDRIEEASRLYYAERDDLGMLDTLRPLHESMEDAAETDCERQFRRDYEKSLKAAYEHGQSYLKVREQWIADEKRIAQEDRNSERYRQKFFATEAVQRKRLERAWELYYDVFRRIQGQLQQSLSTVLRLETVSWRLNRAQDLVLVIPGYYIPNKHRQVTIQCFKEELHVMPTKQRPRKLDIIGSDGNPYGFLLKGQDDLRQDERVMQVFGLMNKHLAQSEERSVRKGAQLKLYHVIVLSSTAGLIQWIRDCDTMYSLVKTFREDRRQVANLEYRIMARNRPELERLPLLHKVDVFQSMQSSTEGRDIERILWYSSRNSEIWLERRTNFGRTLATTSMAGYILGLGDRHPSNIMIARDSGQVMHIDFGDCFEVAKRRVKYPEKIPFRLTRMLVLGLEPCGVRGHFRHIAVAFLRVLRQDNTRTALLTMMEAFVFDPLFSTKLLDGAELTQAQKNDGSTRLPGTVLNIVPTGRVANIVSEAGGIAEGAFKENGGCADDVVPGCGPLPTQLSRHSAPSAADRNGELISEKDAALANRHASLAIDRVTEKLSGYDFEDVDESEPLSEGEQVDRLVSEAQDVLYLCQLFPGWVASW